MFHGFGSCPHVFFIWLFFGLLYIASLQFRFLSGSRADLVRIIATMELCLLFLVTKKITLIILCFDDFALVFYVDVLFLFLYYWIPRDFSYWVIWSLIIHDDFDTRFHIKWILILYIFIKNNFELINSFITII